MAKDLTVGNASLNWMRDELVAHASSLGLGEAVQKLFNGPEDETVLCWLNSASVALFLDRVARIDGHTDTESAFAAFQGGKTAFRNMPWWDNSIWLPFDVSRTGTMVSDPTTFVGSCTSLLKELEEIKQRASIDLGTRPAAYDRMREDISAFYNEDDFRLGENDTFRWIWRALYDGAGLAIRSQSILWGGP